MRRMRKIRALAVATMVLVSGLITSIANPTTPEVVDGWLASQLVSMPSEAEMTVLVHAATPKAARLAAAGAGLTVTDSLSTIGVAQASGSVAAIERLTRMPGVSFIEADRPIEMFMETSHVATRGLEARAGFTGSPGVGGAGVSVAIVDSGIDGTHPMFQSSGSSRVVRNVKLACNETTPAYLIRFPPGGQFPPSECLDQTTIWVDVPGNDTDNASAGGHGTHVAGIAGGGDVVTKDGRKLSGAAPSSSLVGVSIGTSLSIYGGTKGLEWVLNNHASPCAGCLPIKVVNNSWGLSGGGEFDARAATAKVQRSLVAAGVTVVWANGNDGGDGSVNRSSVYGQDPTPGVISVANYFDGDSGDRNGVISSSSSRGRKGRPLTYPDVAAPGESITSACRATLTVCQTGVFVLDGDDPNYATISGTSMAAPHVAGIVAQLLEAKPTATPAELEDALEDTAHKFVTGGLYEPDPANPGGTTSYDKGHGLVDVVAAVAKLRSVSATAAPVVCGAGLPLVSDAEGDATGYASMGRSSFIPSEPSLDIKRGDMTWSPGATPTDTVITLDMKVKDLGTPTASTAAIYDWYLLHNNKEVRLSATRNSAGATTVALTGDRGTGAGRVSATSDPATDTISIKIPANAVTPTVTDSTLIKINRLWTRRSQGALAPLSDEALTSCAFRGGHIANPGGPTEAPPTGGGAPPTPGATLTVTSPVHTWRGEPTTNAGDLFGCDGFYEDERECEKRTFYISPAAGGGIVEVSVEADIAAQDYDVYVFGADGTEVARSANPAGLERTSFSIATAGVYMVEVRAYATVEGEYTGQVELKPVPAGDPGAALVSAGAPQAWSGSVPLASSYLGCQSRTDSTCSHRLVRFDVADGGGWVRVFVDSGSDARDIDLAVFDSSGNRIAFAGSPYGSEEIRLFLPIDGDYTVSVSSFFYPGTSFTATASIV